MSLLEERNSNEYWGGAWTETKIKIVVDYAKAYLTVMSKRNYWKLLFFDGFAGSGIITNEENEHDVLTGVALRILEIQNPRSFDMYYFVDKNVKNAKSLEGHIKEKFPKRNAFVVPEDCNKKLTDLSVFLKSKENKDFKVLAFVDPYGMQVKWSSIEVLKGLPIDLWILVPTGLGVNRLLKNDGNISDPWLLKLKTFLGMDEDSIKDFFYKRKSTLTLFGEETSSQKEKNAIEKAGELYSKKLNEVFKYVSAPFLLKNNAGSVMYHFFLATNNETALSIANDIVKPKLV